LLAIGISFSVAQQQMTDVVYLKNGSIIKCIILEQNVGKNIKIQTIDGSIYVYKYDELEKIEKITTTTENSSVVTRNTNKLDSLNPVFYLYRMYYLITSEPGLHVYCPLSIYGGVVYDESNIVRVGADFPLFIYDGDILLTETMLAVGYDRYFAGFTKNSFFIQTSLEYHILKRDSKFGFSLGLGYSFKTNTGNLAIFGNYTYYDESLSGIRLGFSYARY
jgi:hypothetical protein